MGHAVPPKAVHEVRGSGLDDVGPKDAGGAVEAVGMKVKDGPKPLGRGEEDLEAAGDVLKAPERIIAALYPSRGVGIEVVDPPVAPLVQQGQSRGHDPVDDRHVGYPF